MKIRRMKTEDIAKVKILIEQFGVPTTDAATSERFLILDKLDTHSILVATDDVDEVIGLVHVNEERPTLWFGPRAELSLLIVDQNLRGQGVGRALVVAAEDWARARALPLMRVKSNVKREDAHRFYLREGYDLQKSWHLFVKPLASQL